MYLDCKIKLQKISQINNKTNFPDSPAPSNKSFTWLPFFKASSFISRSISSERIRSEELFWSDCIQPMIFTVCVLSVVLFYIFHYSVFILLQIEFNLKKIYCLLIRKIYGYIKLSDSETILRFVSISLAINKKIVSDFKTFKKIVYVTHLDYQKAFEESFYNQILNQQTNVCSGTREAFGMAELTLLA
ncbi:hypothetical protein BpHYR1_021143 [Brachionus plicatilis]|uniref:Uncharacterized protein n=1 Tax=Brachionus plicatilis TaxID=10195 RepID=A0A3M7PBQ5_BRAPC|nr:hypothetical protein BpHYR1_021143 [Brachionus plicatilis]